MHGRYYAVDEVFCGNNECRAGSWLTDDQKKKICFSLLKVHLQLRGFTVFIDIERLRAGKFDESLLESVRHASNFIIVLTPNSLDRCVGDDEKKDWVHKVSD